MGYDVTYLGRLELTPSALAEWLAKPLAAEDLAALPAAFRPAAEMLVGVRPDQILVDLATERFAEVVRAPGAVVLGARVAGDSSFHLGNGAALGAAFVAASRLGASGSLSVHATEAGAFASYEIVLAPGAAAQISALRRPRIAALERSEPHQLLMQRIRERLPRPAPYDLGERVVALQAEVVRRLSALPPMELSAALRSIPGGAAGRSASFVRWADLATDERAALDALAGGPSPFADLTHRQVPALAILVLALARAAEASSLAAELLACDPPPPWVTAASLALLVTGTEDGARAAFARLDAWGPLRIEVGALARAHAHPLAFVLASETLDRLVGTREVGFRAPDPQGELYRASVLVELVARGSSEGLARICALRLDHPTLRDPSWVLLGAGETGQRVLADRFGTTVEGPTLATVVEAQVREGASRTQEKVQRLLAAPGLPQSAALHALVERLAREPKLRSPEWTAILGLLAAGPADAPYRAPAEALWKRWAAPAAPSRRRR